MYPATTTHQVSRALSAPETSTPYRDMSTTPSSSNNGTSGVGGTSLPPSEPNDQAVHKSNQPKKHVGQVDPDGILHANLTLLLWRRVVLDVDATEETEESCPEDAGNTVSKREIRVASRSTNKRQKSHAHNQ